MLSDKSQMQENYIVNYKHSIYTSKLLYFILFMDSARWGKTKMKDKELGIINWTVVSLGWAGNSLIKALLQSITLKIGPETNL